ncbi:MAG: NAD(P)/FAD-dependent oxidoreductase [Candidatus Bathyarchaeia archaeon]
MENFSNVIVVGGGPCGSFAALHMAKEGVKVTVFEEHSEIGFPCHCAGHLSINGLKTLGLYPLPKEITENYFHGAKIHSPQGREISIRFTAPITCTVNRALFDKYIALLAEKAGASYCLSAKVESLMVEKSRRKGILAKKGGKTIKFFGDIILDAEGTSCNILRQEGLTPPSPSSFVYCVNVEVENAENLEKDMVEVFLGNSYAPGFYAWIIPKTENEAKVGLGVKKGNPKDFLQKLMRKHPAASKKLLKANISKINYHPIPLGGPIAKAYSNGFIAVGDAASQVKPTTGGGVIFGLNCAKIAADVANEAVKTENFSAKFLKFYQKRFMKLLGFDVKAMLGAREMLNRIPDRKLDIFIDFCRKISLEKTFRSMKEIDFQGRTLLGAGYKPRIIAALAYFSLLNLNSLIYNFKADVEEF